ncbi:MAG: ATPase domain-containing protein [Polyangiaceae bacterium]
MSEHIRVGERLPTGVPGLDPLLRGGLPRGGVYILEGPPGAGKTILANQMCYHAASNQLQSVYLTLLAESHARMIGHLGTLSFFRPEHVGEWIQYTSAFKNLEAEGLPGLLRVARELVVGRKAALLVLDGLASALDSSPSDRDYRKFLHELQALASMTDCTVLLLASVDQNPSVRPEHTMVDGIIELSETMFGVRSQRHLRIRKLRATESVPGEHTLRISSEGISVRPRIEAQLLRLPEDTLLEPSTERVDFGVHGFDTMLHGGVPARSTTLVLGPSGSGKTMLGMQFLLAGARKGELGLFFGFYERPGTLLAKGRRVCIGLEDAHQRGLVRFEWEPFGESSIDDLADHLLRIVRELRPRRLVIDGLNGFEQSADVPERLGSVFSTITEELELHEVTTLYTLESPDLLGYPIRSPVRGVSAITHNIILVRHVELDARLHRLISIIKMRDGDYDGAIRELRITDQGIVIADTFRGVSDTMTGEAHHIPASGQLAPATVGSATPQPRESERKGTILIVDDEFGLADLMAEILRDRGYETSIAINGELGLQALSERRPDLVLLDVMMPVLTGPEMLRAMRNDRAYARIPVVFMTALPRTVPRELEGQYETLLQKPFTPEKLFEVVGRVLAKRSEPAA